MVVFLITISMGGYVHMSEVRLASTHSLKPFNQEKKESHNRFNLYSNTLKDLGIDEDITSMSCIRWVEREVFQRHDELVSKKCEVAIHNTQLIPINTESNIYYVFALRKITV